MALYGHMVLQILQPEQASSLIEATIGSIITLPLVIMPDDAGGGRGALDRPRRGCPWPLASPGDEDAVGHGGHRVELGMPLGVPARHAARDAALQAHFLGVGLRLQAAHQHHHVHGDPPLLAQQGVFALDRSSLPSSDGLRAASVTSATLPRTKLIPSSSSRW